VDENVIVTFNGIVDKSFREPVFSGGAADVVDWPAVCASCSSSALRGGVFSAGARSVSSGGDDELPKKPFNLPTICQQIV
jgi:hypothetical protein